MKGEPFPLEMVEIKTGVLVGQKKIKDTQRKNVLVFFVDVCRVMENEIVIIKVMS